jgi:hypothetical protein
MSLWMLKLQTKQHSSTNETNGHALYKAEWRSKDKQRGWYRTQSFEMTKKQFLNLSIGFPQEPHGPSSRWPPPTSALLFERAQSPGGGGARGGENKTPGRRSTAKRLRRAPCQLGRLPFSSGPKAPRVGRAKFGTRGCRVRKGTDGSSPRARGADRGGWWADDSTAAFVVGKCRPCGGGRRAGSQVVAGDGGAPWHRAAGRRAFKASESFF